MSHPRPLQPSASLRNCPDHTKRRPEEGAPCPLCSKVYEGSKGIAHMRRHQERIHGISHTEQRMHWGAVLTLSAMLKRRSALHRSTRQLVGKRAQQLPAADKIGLRAQRQQSEVEVAIDPTTTNSSLGGYESDFSSSGSDASQRDILFPPPLMLSDQAPRSVARAPPLFTRETNQHAPVRANTQTGSLVLQHSRHGQAFLSHLQEARGDAKLDSTGAVRADSWPDTVFSSLLDFEWSSSRDEGKSTEEFTLGNSDLDE